MTLSLILAVVFLCAVLLSLWGRRIGKEPRCRRCLHLTEGLTLPVCPECGAKLDVKRAVAHGMRQRSWPTVFILCLAFVASATYGGIALRRALSASQWEHEVPGWWLSEIEMRLSDGNRLNTAIAGIMYGKSTGRIPQWTVRSAQKTAFDRFSKQAAVAMPPRSVLAYLAQLHAESGDADPKDVVALVRQSFKLNKRWPKTLAEAQMTDPGRPEIQFQPKGWYLEYDYIITDSAGKPIGNEEKNGTGYFSGVIPGPPPYKCSWKFRIVWDKRPGRPMTEWTDSYEFKPHPDDP